MSQADKWLLTYGGEKANKWLLQKNSTVAVIGNRQAPDAYSCFSTVENLVLVRMNLKPAVL